MERRDFLAASISLAGALAMQPARGQPAIPTRAAVVIGVDKVGGFAVLKGARSGARSVAEWLITEGFEVKLLVDDPNPVKGSDIKAAVKAFVDRGTLDQLVVYFGGHGFVNAPGAEIWLLSGAPGDPDEAVNLTESRLLARRSSGIASVVFISDACRSIADSVQTASVRGQIVFPNSSPRPGAKSDVDVFLATQIGDPAIEVTVRASKTDSEAIYTTCFLEAFKRPYATMVEMVDGKPVIPNRRLRHYLEVEVPKRAQAESKILVQLPDAEINSDEPTYIGHVASAQRSAGATVTPTLGDVVSTAVGTPIGGGTPQITANIAAVEALAVRSGFNGARDTIIEARGLPAKLSARTGFTVSGQRVVAVTTNPGFKPQFVSPEDAATPSALVEVDLRGARAASVALRFADGSGTVIAALDEYVGNVVVDEGRVTNVSYVPSRQSPMRSIYESEAKRLDQLHATVATAARFGVFRIEGAKATRDSAAAQMADRIRMLKGIDPTLGLYAAYAYADAGLVEKARSVRSIMRGDLGVDIFDVAMLAGELSAKPPGDRSVIPFCPMLSQGWGLLRVNEVRLPESVVAARDHLRASLWLTLEPAGMQIVEKALRDGRVV